MADGAKEAEQWLAAARAGSPDALGRVLQACRGYLLLVADRELDSVLLPKAGASDLVQETFLDAHQQLGRFHGNSEGEFLAWLRQLLLNNLANFSRRYQGTHKRQVGREVSFDAATPSVPSTPVEGGSTPSPSSQAIANEKSQALQITLERLPEEYRRVIVLRYLEERSFDEISRLMDRSANAVRKLWARAVRRLRQEMGHEP
jgi:RNA polymerase sigma-70 factor, ECF subfamily